MPRINRGDAILPDRVKCEANRIESSFITNMEVEIIYDAINVSCSPQRAAMKIYEAINVSDGRYDIIPSGNIRCSQFTS
jgi:hypothetical protein